MLRIHCGTGYKQTKNRAIFALHKTSIESLTKEILTKGERTWNQTKQEATTEKKQPGLIEAAMYDLPPLPQIVEQQEITGKKKQLGIIEAAMHDLPPLPQIVEFIRPMSDENQRLVSQGGLFTRSPDNIDLER